MAGNVWQWCQDWHGDQYYADSPPENPAGPKSGDSRLCRGGAWNAAPEECRSAARRHQPIYRADSSLGFRVVVGASPLLRAASPQAEPRKTTEAEVRRKPEQPKDLEPALRETLFLPGNWVLESPRNEHLIDKSKSKEFGECARVRSCGFRPGGADDGREADQDRTTFCAKQASKVAIQKGDRLLFTLAHAAARNQRSWFEAEDDNGMFLDAHPNPDVAGKPYVVECIAKKDYPQGTVFLWRGEFPVASGTYWLIRADVERRRSP
jgi:hypothetical protein